MGLSSSPPTSSSLKKVISFHVVLPFPRSLKPLLIWFLIGHSCLLMLFAWNPNSADLLQIDDRLNEGGRWKRWWRCLSSWEWRGWFVKYWCKSKGRFALDRCCTLKQYWSIWKKHFYYSSRSNAKENYVTPCSYRNKCIARHKSLQLEDQVFYSSHWNFGSKYSKPCFFASHFEVSCKDSRTICLCLPWTRNIDLLDVKF